MSSILIVEDEMAQREPLAEYFRQKGYQMFTAHNGEDALPVIEKECVDLVVSDIRMPKMDGLNLVSKMSEVKPNVPIILITGCGTLEMAVEAMKNGAADFLLKPVDLEKLTFTIKVNLERAVESRREEELIPFSYGSISYNLPVKNYHLLSVLASRLGNLIFEHGYIKAKGRHAIKTVLYEVFSNAMFHGSLEVSSEGSREENSNGLTFMDRVRLRTQCPNYGHKSITVVMVMEKEELILTISDDGHGFDWQEKLCEAEDPENLYRPYGRGLMIIKKIMGEENYRFNKKGNVLTLIFQKRRGKSVYG